MHRAVAGLVMLCAACEARLDGVVPPGDDAGAPQDDAGPEPVIDAAIDAPACFNGRVVFLQFERQPLTRGAPSDSTQNRASWMQIAAGTAPGYRVGAAGRDQDINTIVDGVRALLAQFPITVVTTRPVSGQYMMIVFGGAPQDVGSRFGLGVQQLDCGDLVRNDVAWLPDRISGLQAINIAVGSIGFGVGLTATTVRSDCMCGWDNACVPTNAAPCTLTAGIARDPNANQRCPGLTTQDEVAALDKAFCQ